MKLPSFTKLIKAVGAHEFPGLRGLLDGFNYYDVKRVKEVGPDRAAAEWIVRCDGKVKFDKFGMEFEDYNLMIREMAKLDPGKESDSVHVVSVNATDASITGYGCRHFTGLNHLVDVRFVRCRSLTDIGFTFMSDAVGKTLQCLHVESCPKITDDGLRSLENFVSLESLLLHDLRGVIRKAELLQFLKDRLPKCDIHFRDVQKP